jgi:hypothetical protein
MNFKYLNINTFLSPTLTHRTDFDSHEYDFDAHFSNQQISTKNYKEKPELSPVLYAVYVSPLMTS